MLVRDSHALNLNLKTVIWVLIGLMCITLMIKINILSAALNLIYDDFWGKYGCLLKENIRG